MAESNIPAPLRSFGRRKGRKLRPGKQGLMDDLLPGLQIAANAEMQKCGNAEELSALLHFRTSALWLEIGFGGGEHLAHQAALNPNVGIIGCEPYINGIGDLLKRLSSPSPLAGEGGVGGASNITNGEIVACTPHPNLPPQGGKGLSNIRIFPDDARLLVDKLPDRSIERVFILYPDPWPKARHHKRRLVSKETLDMLARVMKPSAQLRLATDHPDYCAWMLEHLLAHSAFAWEAKNCNDWLKPWEDWIPTKYEQKGLAGMPTYLTFVKQ